MIDDAQLRSFCGNVDDITRNLALQQLPGGDGL